MLRLRLLALFLDLLLCAAPADAAGLAATGLLWRYWPAGRDAVPWIWGAVAASATLAFLARDARGGRARRWLALEIERLDGLPPGLGASILRNLPLLIPGWNLYDAWPAVREAGAPRRIDRWTGTRILHGS